MKKGVFEIDFMHDDLAEDCTKEDVVNLVRKMYDDYYNEEAGAKHDDIEIEVVDMEGPAGGNPVVHLIGNIDEIAYFLMDAYDNSMEDVDEVIDTYLEEEL